MNKKFAAIHEEIDKSLNIKYDIKQEYFGPWWANEKYQSIPDNTNPNIALPIAPDEQAFDDWQEYASATYNDYLTDDEIDKLAQEASLEKPISEVKMKQPSWTAKWEYNYISPKNPVSPLEEYKHQIEAQKKLDLLKGKIKTVPIYDQGADLTVEAKPPGKRAASTARRRYKKDDRVITPNGNGSVWSVDKDGTVCVELDNDPNILHEFEKKEIKKIK